MKKTCCSTGLLVLFCMLTACSSQSKPAATQQTASVSDEVMPAEVPLPAAPKNGISGSLRILSYNVLRYGNGCQGDNRTLHGYLKTIIQYANPDVVGLVKVDAIKQSPADPNGEAPVGFADSILNQGMNTAFAGRYAVCPFTNKAHANNVNLLFYDRKKLGYSGMETLVNDETDFNLYKLYLRASVAGNSRDTAFVYFLLNHTESGDKSKKRDRQMMAVMAALRQRFSKMPNIIDMGDFNLRNTNEPGYQVLIAGSNKESGFSDPPFALDKSVSYPADWESNPDAYARFLTTSTRKKDKPNDCGTSGGAKFWFDHILLSSPLATGTNGLKYVPKSFRVIGNDGNRTGRSANADKNPNTSVPANVAEALFQFSNKYPVMLELSGK